MHYCTPSCSSLSGRVWCAALERMAAAESCHDPSAAAARAATPREPHAGVAAQPARPPLARAVSHVRCMHLPHDCSGRTCETAGMAGLSAMRHDNVAMAPRSQARLPPCVNSPAAHGFHACPAAHQWLDPCVLTTCMLGILWPVSSVHDHSGGTSAFTPVASQAPALARRTPGTS